MARRNKTPESILNAPISVPVPIVEHKGVNRRNRRWTVTLPTRKRVFRHYWRRIPVTNTPYRRVAK